MSKDIRWLREQTEVWVAEGVVTTEQAARIRGLYPDPAAGLPWALLIFSGLGAVVVGLGVILLFAYNWDALPRGVKLSVIFAALAAAHGAGLWQLRPGSRLRGLGEALCLLGTMLFGAAIWLIAQIYHIEEHFPNGFLFWGLGALALAWAVPSALQGMLAAVVLAIWSGTEAVGFDAPVHGAPVAVLVAVGLLAWRLDSVVLLFVTAGAMSVSALINAGAVGGDLVPRTALSLGALLVAGGVLSRQAGWFPRAAWVWSGLGWAQFLLPAYLLTFHDLTFDLLGRPAYSGIERGAAWYATLLSPLGLATGAWAATSAFAVRGSPAQPRAKALRYEDWVTLLGAGLATVFAYLPIERGDWLPSGLFNLLLLLLAVAWMARGCREGRLLPTVTGALTLVALTVARYFDLFESLAVRGLAFLVVGATLFATGLQFSRARRRVEGGTGGTP